MNKKEENLSASIIAIQFVNELQLFIDNTLIPGEIRPAIFWLKQRTTEELRTIFFYKTENIQSHMNQKLEHDRVTLMKRILLFYYPECEALAIKHTNVSTN